ncbi:hypothetical protein K470DRAFT_259560 [Piedraia hortae CBS 480.64]|uniref:Zn(2)-C6 fungal-type domain-containing protein n=1 Tax=Piedraia hortae CBS 480.64 TaxID=1314780 RepID=A0A6A7BUL1_9PEZI|nr:hypothetical protein K470DRAFT_259560 [Piedraia hortae CBS 480.64]
MEHFTSPQAPPSDVVFYRQHPEEPRPDFNMIQTYPSGPHLPIQFQTPEAVSGPSASTRTRERSKVSRACDECRRKKIRCDAVDETGTIACSNCSRVGCRCAFSRQPLKRGPSKGYIKDLASRLDSLERSAGHVEPRTGEKRTRDGESAIETGDGIPRLPFWQRGGRPQLPIDEGTEVPDILDWDDEVVDEYYRLIHQTFPLLPSSKNNLRRRLADCPLSLREAFLAALDCLIRTFPTSKLAPGPGYAQTLKRAAERLAQYPFDRSSLHAWPTELVYLQTLLLMALESDNHGPASIRGQAGPSRAEWLGRAAGVAGQLEINVLRNPAASTSLLDGDRDSQERLARRVWWVLFILDRWHASSTADLLKLPEHSVVLLPEDQILLGESTYNLARLSFIVGHLAAILSTTKTPSTDVMSPTNPASALLNMTLAGEIDRFRESVESVWGSLNLVHLSFHHCHLLVKRLNPTTEPVELVGHAVKVATVLNSRLTPVTPLNHHFGALAAMTLCDLSRIPRTRKEARSGLLQLKECLGKGRGLAGTEDSIGWDGAVRKLVGEQLEKLNGGLVEDVETLDPTRVTRYGYLTALGQGFFDL